LETTNYAHLAAKLAKEFYAKQITFTQFIERYPKMSGIKNIEELFVLITEVYHLPDANDELKKIIADLIAKLEAQN
jgi:hypothetical protein